MSFSLSRVPKRVALTALQGLLVGTSCTFLFVFEDRRRRIEQARRAVHNGEKVRAAKRKKQSRPRNDTPSNEGPLSLSTTLKETTLLDHGTPSFTRYPPSTPTPSPSRQKKPVDSAQIADNIRRIKEATSLGDADSLRVGVLILKRIASNPDAVKEEEQSRLMQAALNLYRQCKEKGSETQTSRILEYISKIGPVPPAEFYALNPQNHVARALNELETKIKELQNQDLQTRETASNAAWLKARLAAQEKLDQVFAFLLPELQEDGTIPDSKKWEWARLAEKTIRLSLKLADVRIGSGMYARNLHYADAQTQQAIKNMGSVTKSEPFGRVVRKFVQLKAELSKNVDAAIWNTIGNVVSDSACIGTSPDPAGTLLYLAEYCPSGMSLRTTWVAKLLSVDWQQFNREQDLQQTLALFQKFEALGGCQKVTHVDGVYRTMIEIALDAQEWQTADDFLVKLKTIKPAAATHPQVLGMLAKAKAKLGDWESVWADFRQMEPREHVGEVFVPILKQYAKTHTVRETDTFLRMSMEELHIPITPYMVTLVGNQYGELRDVSSFVTWLEYCAAQGVQVDAAFANTILRNCKRHWDFDYQALKRVYQTLQTLNPTFVDEVTQNMIVTAALTATRRAATPMYIHREVSSLSVRFRKEAKLSDPHDVRLWMRRAFAVRNYRLVQTMYEKAVKRGAMLDDGHLLLNVRAIMRHNANIPKAVRILKEAKEQDLLVDRATAEVFIFYIRQVFSGDVEDKELVLENVRSVLSRLQEAQLEVSRYALLRVAHLCLAVIYHVEAALNFAMSALSLKDASYPDDIPTFQVFLLAYTMRTDPRGLEWTIRGAFKAGILHKERVMEALRVSRRLFLKQRVRNAETKEAIHILEQALGQVQSDRLELTQEREQMEKTTLSIMAKAASAVTTHPSTYQQEAIHQIEEDLESLIADRESQVVLA